MTFPTIAIAVRESSQVFEARRAALAMAEPLGWDEQLAGKLAIAVTEAATNLVKHAGGGEIHVSRCEQQGVPGIELLCLDRGPGLADPSVSLRDGFSTTGTAGTGLGAIQRLSTEFDLYSQAGKGLALMARFYPDKPTTRAVASKAEWTISAVQVPLRGETVCGDHWGVREQQGKLLVMLADGLGHGVGAAEASREAVAVLERSTELDPVALLDSSHRCLRSTRGAAIAIARIDSEERSVQFAGVGNISAMILNGGSVQHLVSHNGTAGQAVRKLQGFTYPWPPSGLLILHSDGLTTSWRLDAYPGLGAKHPSVIAGVLYRDASRGRDDACIVIVRART